MSKNNYVYIADLQVEKSLFDLISNKICPAVFFNAEKFWLQAAQIFHRFTQRNKELLDKRDSLASKIDHWYCHAENTDMVSYQKMLNEMGYIVPKGEDFKIDVSNVDDEIAKIAGPQLVVPVNNARYALSAANARWGSLFDALYGSNLIEGEIKKGYDEERGEKVLTFSLDFLDQAIPLNDANHKNVKKYSIQNNSLIAELEVGITTLEKEELLRGFTGKKDNPKSLLFKHNGLHIEILLDKESQVGQKNRAGIKDIILESALTTIQDCEDSVSAVDGEDKVTVYSNWFELMEGSLSVELTKNNKKITRNLTENRHYKDIHNNPFSLSGRCTLLIRNVGLRMTTPAILDRNNNELPEGILDGIVTVLASLNDIRGKGGYGNSKTGSMYIVKPKMHGPEEVAFSNDLFAALEDMYALPRFTLKMGLMDEERRTSVNLSECIRQIKNRVVFINTGFLDRTGDEIHTSMKAGTFLPKAIIKQQKWFTAYENQNVNIGLQCGFSHNAQIGKGMWPKPDDMKGLYEIHIAHPKSGANTAWVPSPTAAIIHALHYHQVDVFQIQQEMMDRQHHPLSEMLTIPLTDKKLSDKEIITELENNCQGLLGYVIRWIDQGIGCSKVSDINGIALMEDRATLRISSQHIANWLYHGVITKKQVENSLQKMAKIVDQQNADDKNYQAMAPNFDGIAYRVAYELIFNGVIEPNGYTEPELHRMRIKKKAIV